MNKILIVDDTPKNIQLLGSILSEQDYEIEYAQDGQEAVNLVKIEDFDLILMDVMMPVMDGYEACQTIKKMEDKSEIPIIFITAKSDAESITHGFECGGVDYISKPFNESELLARVKTHIALKVSTSKLKDMNQILEKKVAEKTIALQKANEDLKVLDSAKNEFLQLISHEIRTPLNGVIGLLEIIEDSFSEDEHELFEILDTSCRRLENFSYMALDITKLKSMKQNNLEKNEVDISDLFQNNILHAQKSTDKETPPIINNITPANNLLVDEKYFNKCIYIIISNALKHSPSEGKVEVTGNEKDEFYHIHIKDEGDGFPDFIIKNGVNAFSSEHVDGNHGLDLYLSKLIVEAHGGEMHVENSNGANVYIQIPLKTT